MIKEVQADLYECTRYLCVELQFGLNVDKIIMKLIVLCSANGQFPLDRKSQILTIVFDTWKSRLDRGFPCDP